MNEGEYSREVEREGEKGKDKESRTKGRSRMEVNWERGRFGPVFKKVEVKEESKKMKGGEDGTILPNEH